IGRITNERQIISDELGCDSKLRLHRSLISNRSALSVDLNDAVFHYALREILVRSPDADLGYALVLRGKICSRRECIICLELNHCPRCNPQRDERFLERDKLLEQRGLDSFAGFVIGPQIISK